MSTARNQVSDQPFERESGVPLGNIEAVIDEERWQRPMRRQLRLEARTNSVRLRQLAERESTMIGHPARVPAWTKKRGDRSDAVQQQRAGRVNKPDR